MSATPVRMFAAIGDSFTAGIEPAVEPWPQLSARMIGCPCANLAAAGKRSDEVAAAQLQPAIDLAPDLVSVICGANDVLLTSRPDIAGFAATFSLMLERLAAELPVATIVTATYPDVTARSPLRPRSRARVSRGLRELNGAIRWLARRHGAACLEFEGHPEHGRGENFAGDDFHPSARGHRKVAGAFVLAVTELKEASA